MALQTVTIGSGGMTDDEVVTAINNASTNITRAASVDAAARPIAADEVTATELAAGAVDASAIGAGVAKANLDAMTDAARGYIQSNPTSGDFRVVDISMDTAGGDRKYVFDDVPA